MRGRKTLLTGWFSFLHGEITAGDALALRHVQAMLDDAGLPYDTVWSPGYRPEALSLDDVDPQDYGRLVFVCGPLYGPQVAALHERFAHCYRVAIGTSTVDPRNAAVTGFHRILGRDGPGSLRERLDLAAGAPPEEPVPVVGVILTSSQQEYGNLRRHDSVSRTVTDWLAGKDCARLEMDTRLDAGDWRHCANSAQFLSLMSRLDAVVTDRLHGLVLALRSGVPALAVDPVEGGAKVSAQARVCRWPALVPAEYLEAGELERWWLWCLGTGRELAASRAREFAAAARSAGSRG